jgi:hypothetical protein
MPGSYLAFKKICHQNLKILAFILNAMIKNAKKTHFCCRERGLAGQRENIEGIDSTVH